MFCNKHSEDEDIMLHLPKLEGVTRSVVMSTKTQVSSKISGDIYAFFMFLGVILHIIIAVICVALAWVAYDFDIVLALFFGVPVSTISFFSSWPGMHKLLFGDGDYSDKSLAYVVAGLVTGIVTVVFPLVGIFTGVIEVSPLVLAAFVSSVSIGVAYYYYIESDLKSLYKRFTSWAFHNYDHIKPGFGIVVRFLLYGVIVHFCAAFVASLFTDVLYDELTRDVFWTALWWIFGLSYVLTLPVAYEIILSSRMNLRPARAFMMAAAVWGLIGSFAIAFIGNYVLEFYYISPALYAILVVAFAMIPAVVSYRKESSEVMEP